MARILIAWELGEAFGHLARSLQLAEGLVARGHSVTLALKDIRLPVSVCLPRGITVLPAPLTPHATRGCVPPVNYADMLLRSGFSNAQDVAARLNAWRGIFTLVKPDVLIADHAPSALLAARGVSIPHLAIGNGFAVPPSIFPWPTMRPWEKISDQELVASEACLDRVTEAAQRLLNSLPTLRIRDSFGTNDILDTFAELDHYGARTHGRYVGPIASLPRALRVDWQSESGPKVLAYLRPAIPGFSTILQALARLEVEALCVAPGMTSEAAKRMATRTLRIALSPVELMPLLHRASLAIGYGNSGFCTQALLAGVPLAMQPQHVEQALFARRVEQLGAGQLLNSREHANAICSQFQLLLNDGRFRNAALAFKAQTCGFSFDNSVEMTLAHAEYTLLGAQSSDQKAFVKNPSSVLPKSLESSVGAEQ